ncbi:phage major capsid protein [Undibacterium sp. Ji42W]|uniref:phage major capsid protein n=1 Tax=Undibacterium sp. Ji42W TaxID=3413039 RepID=UPI003BF34C95
MSNKRKLDTGTVQLKPLQRFARMTASVEGAEVRTGVVDEQTRTITFSFSSEAEIETWYGTEVLSHQAGAARLKRINSGGPLLFNHDMNDLLGVVEKAWIGADKRGYCTVRFGSDERGDWAMKQVQDRILQNVSFMYRIHVYEVNDDTDVYTATDWDVYEITLCTIPADTSIGVSRSVASDEQDVQVRRPQASNTTPAVADNEEGNDPMFRNKHILRNAATDTATGGGSAAPAAVVPTVDPAQVEQARVAEIEAMCKTHKIADETRNLLVTLKQPIESARGIVLNEVLARGKGVASLGNTNNPDLSEPEKARYSMLRAINASIGQREGKADAWKSAGLEREVSLDIAKRTGKETAGIFVPTNLTFASRAADYSFGTGAGLSATSGGANLVATNLLTGSFIELLRNKARLLGLGAQILSGLTGNIDIPRQKAAGQVYWIGEGGTLGQAGAQFDKISLSPKHIGAISVITRNMLQQSTPDVEMLARADLLATIALGIDSAGLCGTGTAGQPLGIANQAGIGAVLGGVNGGAITIDNLIDMETIVASNNADVDSMAYLTNAKIVGTLKKLKSTTGQYLWTNSPMGQRSLTPGEINGYSVARSNQARSNLTKGTGTNLSEVYFGDWSQVIMGEWGVIEILPNPFAPGIYEQGGVELRVLQTVDIGVRHAQSFAIMSDAITQ